jgi:endo-1,4-beta-xylanase
MKRLNDLGLEVQISEMDVQTQDVDLPLDEKLSQQAQVYAEVLQACLQAQNCTSFSLWGFTDQYTWIPEQIGKSDTPLIFDKAYQPKPAYTAISNTLRACCTNKGNSCKA